MNILENTEFSDELTRKLLEMPKPIYFLYDVWLGTDGGIWEMLEDVIRNCEEAI